MVTVFYRGSHCNANDKVPKNIIKSVFPNGEVQFNRCHYAADQYFIDMIYESNSDIFNALLYKKYIDDVACINTREVYLRMNFCPYGQADRDFSSASFGTFKYFAKLINEANFTRVIIVDPHSDVMVSTLDRCAINYTIRNFNREGYDLLFYPDAGAAKKYSEIINDTHYIVGNKKRNLEDGSIINYEILADKSDVEGKSILIVDDLVVRGGTYKYAAKALKELGAKQIDLFITHVMASAKEFWTEGYKECGIDNVYTSNTLKLDWATNFYDIDGKDTMKEKVNYMNKLIKEGVL